MAHDQYSELAELLDALESELRSLAFWSENKPSSAAFCSTLPFCADSMVFKDWLQWVLLPQMRHLVALHAPLPKNCAISPMAEIAFETTAADTTRLHRIIERLDQVITTNPGKQH